jgi:ABC-type nitrate/sulfonate/bicarbonate transport system ATPase subunit
MNDILPARDPLLVFDQLTVSYRNGSSTPVLDKFSLKIEAGKFLSVVGPSGCGKSTLLHATGGFIKPSSGAIHLGGELIQGPSLRVGFVSQRYSLFPWLTVEDNIAFGLRSQGRPDDEMRAAVDRLLEVIGLTSQRRYYPEQLSGGMQQRVALARAMAPEPPVMLLDEPFSSLDAETRQRMRELLLRLWTEHQTTILFVTHDIEESLLLADRVLLLEGKSGPARTLEVPFPRPRAHSLPLIEPFQKLVETISQHYGAPLND